jgi:hypothetical protein
VGLTPEGLRRAEASLEAAEIGGWFGPVGFWHLSRETVHVAGLRAAMVSALVGDLLELLDEPGVIRGGRRAMDVSDWLGGAGACPQHPDGACPED